MGSLIRWAVMSYAIGTGFVAAGLFGAAIAGNLAIRQGKALDSLVASEVEQLDAELAELLGE